MLITSTKLSTFSRSPVIGVWWEELLARRLFLGEKPEGSALDKQLFADGLRHEQVLLTKLEAKVQILQDHLLGLKSNQQYYEILSKEN